MLTGECNCGAVAFRIEGAISQVYVCHCSVCRRSTGANGIAVVITAKAHFSWIRGEQRIARWQKPDADWHTAFCSQCGSTLPGADDAHNMYVPAALLGPEAGPLRVVHHIHVDSKAEWDEIGDAGEIHAEGIRPG